jgi:2-oxoglutarate dehydrogenase E2 component (dihydrolipoamide succinyltransferase)
MDDVVVVIETDKVSVDVRAPAAGTITATFGQPDDVVQVTH